MLLINCVDWDSLGFKVIGDSPGEQDALDMINEFKPDVVFVDICMPIIDGIQMSSHIMKVLPECRIIIVTGHQEFEYAREGLKIGVFDYILKPINPKEIMDAAQRAKDEILLERKEKKDVEKLKSHMKDSFPDMREQFLAGLVKFGYNNIKTESLDYFGIELSEQYVSMAVVSFEQKEECDRDDDLYYLFEKEISQKDRIYYFNFKNETVVLSNNSETDLYKVLQSIRSKLAERGKCIISCGVSDSFGSLKNIPDAYLQAKKALEFKVVCGKGKIVRYSNIANTSRKNGLPSNNIDEMKFLIKSGLVTNAQNAAAEALDELMACATPRRETLHAAGAKVLSECLASVKECNIPMSELFGEDNNPYEKILALETLPQMKRYMKKCAGKIAEAVFEDNKRCTHGMVENIKTYIEENISDSELTLSKVADHFYLNHSYLSRIYKKETGKHIFW